LAKTPKSFHEVRLRAGQVGYFKFGEAWFHVDPEISKAMDIPPYIAACHEDTHRRTQNNRFTIFQHFLSFAALAADRAKIKGIRSKATELQTEAVGASVYTHEGCAVINMLMRCFPNYARHFDRLYELFSSFEPYAAGVKAYEKLLGPLPALALGARGNLAFRVATEFAAQEIAAFALNNNVLRTFQDFGKLSAGLWHKYLVTEAPDVRLNRLVQRLGPQLKPGELSVRFAAALSEAAARHDRTAEGKLGTEHIEDDFAMDAERVFRAGLKERFGDFGIELIHHFDPDPESEAFPAAWFASLDRLFEVDRGFRVAWLESSFAANIYKAGSGQVEIAGPGRSFRLATPTKWIVSKCATNAKVGDTPGFWPTVDAIASTADAQDHVLAISFRATDKGSAAGVVSLWEVDSKMARAKLSLHWVYALDHTIVDRPPGRRETKYPWLVHADGYTAYHPLIRGFVRPGDASVMSISTMNTFQVARTLDQVVSMARKPLLFPTITMEEAEPSDEYDWPPGPDTWLVSEVGDVWRWSLCPGYFDMLEQVILERETLTAAEKEKRLGAVDRVVRSVDKLGGTRGVLAAEDDIWVALDPIPDEIWPEVVILHSIGPWVAFSPERIVGATGIVVPDSPVRPHSGEKLTSLEKFFENWLPPSKRIEAPRG
jgi:hypothetical protein